MNDEEKKDSDINITLDEAERKILTVVKNRRSNEFRTIKEVLNTLSNSKVYRTDLDGSIMYEIKNNKLKIETSIQ